MGDFSEKSWGNCDEFAYDQIAVFLFRWFKDIVLNFRTDCKVE